MRVERSTLGGTHRYFTLRLGPHPGHDMAYALVGRLLGYWMLTDICVPPRHQGKGHGRAVMADVLGWAEETGSYPLGAAPAPTPGLTFEQLVAWYERLGFRWRNGDRASLMFWSPNENP